MLPLSAIEPGRRAEIVEIRAGRGLAMRLANMGFYPGTIIDVISNIGRGPLIIAREGIRLGLGFGMANKIWVRILR
ncbi:MAG TPA: ferrous iron transport protein A [Candidatus Omnitrophica bacterium]|nr:ferrous iron transport protein A [Candidatus Omnitrophota bacterium]